MTTKDLVLAHLRREKIRLWLPPYYRRSTRGGDDDADDEALAELAESLSKTTTIAREDEHSNDGGGGEATAGEIRGVLVELRSHAVRKLEDRHSVDVRIMASGRHRATLFDGGGGDSDAAATAAANAAFSGASWGDEITVSRGGTTRNRDDDSEALRLHVRVTNLSPALTVDEFSSDIRRALNARNIRVIWKGKNLLSSSSSSGGGGKQETLRNIVSANNKNKSDGNNGAMGASNPKKNKKGELLCFVSGFGYVGPVAARDAAVGVDPSVRTDSSIIESIRVGAHTIQNSFGGSRFEVTDQSGNLVPMSQSDTVAFLTALGLHRIGRSKMERRRGGHAGGRIGGHAGGRIASNSTDDEPDDERDVASALAFLLEADAEWNDSPALDGWKQKVDNFGLLQLDIAWCYLLLESLDGLADAVRRLDVAERVLRKQVHSNFVTLALAQAEMNNPIPPLCAVFVRLFLLQGVADKIMRSNDGDDGDDDGDGNTSATDADEEGGRLGWARLLCHRLRSSCPADRVRSLCDAYVVDPPVAIAALRRSDGDPDAAGRRIALDRDEERRAAGKRRRQRRLGKCANGVDFVDVDLVLALSGMLGYVANVADRGDLGDDDEYEDEDGNEAFGDEELSTSTLIVVGLLRLSNNGVNQSLDLYNRIGADQVIERVARLDESSGRNKLRSATRNVRQKPTAEHEVRDVDLAMLVSMGAGETRGRNALKSTGNVESALLWISRDIDAHDDAKADAETSEEASSSGNNGYLEGRANNSVASDDSEGDGGRYYNDSNSGEDGIDDAHELLERELGNALGNNSKQLLEQEWLGVDMQDEWDLIQKYT